MNRGILYAALAYVCWGLFPLYFHLLVGIGPVEVVMHRTLWSLVFLLGVLLWRRHWDWLPRLAAQPRVLLAFAASALLLAANWLTYVWAVTSHHVLDSSLGYFMLPLVNVALGFFVLHERPRKGQWLAVAVAASGVLWLWVLAGHPPWVALTLAVTFGFYGLLRKVAVLGALEGLALETLMLAPLAARAQRFCAGGRRPSLFADAGRAAHGDAAAAVCRRRTAHHPDHHGHLAIHLAESAIRARSLAVWRGLRSGTVDRFCPDLGGLAGLQRGRLAVQPARQNAVNAAVPSNKNAPKNHARTDKARIGVNFAFIRCINRVF